MKELFFSILNNKAFAHPITFSYVLSFVYENIKYISYYLTNLFLNAKDASDYFLESDFVLLNNLSFWALLLSQTAGKSISAIAQTLLKKVTEFFVSNINDWDFLNSYRIENSMLKNKITKIKNLESTKFNNLINEIVQRDEKYLINEESKIKTIQKNSYSMVNLYLVADISGFSQDDFIFINKYNGIITNGKLEKTDNNIFLGRVYKIESHKYCSIQTKFDCNIEIHNKNASDNQVAYSKGRYRTTNDFANTGATIGSYYSSRENSETIVAVDVNQNVVLNQISKDLNKFFEISKGVIVDKEAFYHFDIE